jgi:hypothetical protein
MFKKLMKAAVAVTLSPVALVADIVTLPASADSGRSPFSRTGKLLDSAGKNVSDAVSAKEKNHDAN